MTDLSEMFTNNADQGNVDTGNQEGDLLFIGEGKKYVNDKEADKALAFKEDHIQKIESENASLREEAQKAKTLDDVLKSIKAQNQDNESTDQTDTGNHQDSVDIDALVAKAIDEKMISSQKRTIEDSNSKEVFEKLTEKYGSRAGELFSSKGKDLGIDLDQLSKISPKAVLEYFKEAPIQSTGSGYQSGTYNTANLTSSNSSDFGTYSYWNERMKSGKISRDVCFKEQHKSLQEMGAAKFYSQS